MSYNDNPQPSPAADQKAIAQQRTMAQEHSVSQETPITRDGEQILVQGESKAQPAHTAVYWMTMGRYIYNDLGQPVVPARIPSPSRQGQNKNQNTDQPSTRVELVPYPDDYVAPKWSPTSTDVTQAMKFKDQEEEIDKAIKALNKADIKKGEKGTQPRKAWGKKQQLRKHTFAGSRKYGRGTHAGVNRGRTRGDGFHFYNPVPWHQQRSGNTGYQHHFSSNDARCQTYWFGNQQVVPPTPLYTSAQPSAAFVPQYNQHPFVPQQVVQYHQPTTAARGPFAPYHFSSYPTYGFSTVNFRHIYPPLNSQFSQQGHSYVTLPAGYLPTDVPQIRESGYSIPGNVHAPVRGYLPSPPQCYDISSNSLHGFQGAVQTAQMT